MISGAGTPGEENIPLSDQNVAERAIQDTKAFVANLRGLIALADALGDAADLGPVDRHLRAAIYSLTNRRDVLQNEVTGLEEALATAKNELENTRRAAVESAQSIQDDAKAKLAAAEAALREAKAEAKRIVNAANDQARAVIAAEIEAIKSRL